MLLRKHFLLWLFVVMNFAAIVFQTTLLLGYVGMFEGFPRNQGQLFKIFWQACLKALAAAPAFA